MNVKPALELDRLRFTTLQTPIAAAVLKRFRRDAGWNAGHADDGAPFRPGSRVQWATVSLNGNTVAIARLELAPPQFAFLSDLIVLDAWRGRGIGAWFMDRLEAYCAATGIPRLLLRPVSGSQGFYERRRFADDPLVPGFMRKDLLLLSRRQLFA